jgi:hypothetical protein
VTEQGDQRPPDLARTWARGPYAAPTGPATWTPPLVQEEKRLRGPWLVGGALVVVLLVGAGLFLFRGDPLTLGGRYVTAPEAVLADADDVFAGYVEERQGVTADDSRCWFELAEDGGHEVRDTLACGPVLFVDGDAERAWLRFPVSASAQGGDVRLSVAALPSDATPSARPDADLLWRPDGGSPPAGTAGIEVPPPSRAAAGWTTTGPFPDLTFQAPEVTARLSGPAAAVTVTGLARTDRVGAGEEARRPAEGEEFLAVRYAIGPGEGLSSAPPALSYQVGGAEPVPVAPELVTPGSTVEVLLSVPAGAEAVDLVVQDAGLRQRLSLLTGAPGEENVRVLARTNRRVELGVTQQLTGTLSSSGRITASAPFSIALDRAALQWFAGADGKRHPADPGDALLLLDVSMGIPDQEPGAVPVEYLSLTLPDGSVLRAGDLDEDPGLVLPAFLVPADFTDGVIGFGGAATFPDGAVADFGAGRLEFPIAFPAG